MEVSEGVSVSLTEPAAAGFGACATYFDRGGGQSSLVVCSCILNSDVFQFTRYVISKVKISYIFSGGLAAFTKHKSEGMTFRIYPNILTKPVCSHPLLFFQGGGVLYFFTKQRCFCK
jgi:hypothetical protein